VFAPDRARLDRQFRGYLDPLRSEPEPTFPNTLDGSLEKPLRLNVGLHRRSPERERPARLSPVYMSSAKVVLRHIETENHDCRVLDAGAIADRADDVS
jgi:hypothetical protein